MPEALTHSAASSTSEGLTVTNLSWKQYLELSACTRCGECTLWCPTYDMEKKEGITPRGKAKNFTRLVRSRHGLRARLFGPKSVDKAVMDSFLTDLYQCTVCAQCREVCPLHMDTPRLWEGIRRGMVLSGLAPLDGHAKLVRSIKDYDNPWQQPRSARDRWAKAAVREGRLTGITDITKTRAEVLFYVGCTASFDPTIKEMAVNTVRVLRRLGIDAGILGVKEKCCGSTLKRVGDFEFERLAGENIRTFNSLGISTLVCVCSGCFKTIRQDYPGMGRLNFEVLHITELVSRAIGEGRLRPHKEVPLTITYHDPCHLGRHNGIYEEPRKILGSIPGVRLVEMERNRAYSRCCGSGGGVKAAFKGLQEAISDKRVEDALHTGAQALATACPFCFQSLKDAVARTGAPLVMRELTELLDSSLS